MKKTTLTACFCALLGWAQAQDAYFSTQIARDSFGLHERIKVTYTLHNAEASTFNPPSFHPLQQLPSSSTNVESKTINGRTISKKSFTFYLQASEAGHFQIPAAKIQTNQGELESNAAEIVVVEGYEPQNIEPEENELKFGGGNFPQMPFGDVDDLFNNPNLFRFDMPNLEGFEGFPNMDNLWKDFDKMFEQQFKNQLPPGAEKKDKPKDEPKIYKL